MRVNHIKTSTIYDPSFISPNIYITTNNNYQRLYNNEKSINNQGYLNQFNNNNNNYYINPNNLNIENKTNQAQYNINNNLFPTNNKNTVFYGFG